MSFIREAYALCICYVVNELKLMITHHESVLYTSPSHTSASSDFGINSTDIVFYPGSSTIMCVNISVAQDGAVVTLDSGSDEGVVLMNNNATISLFVNDCKSNTLILMQM